MGIFPEFYFRFIQLLQASRDALYTALALHLPRQSPLIVSPPGDFLMRSWIFFLTSLPLLLTTATLSASGDSAVTLPERKAGLWELKTMMDEGNGPHDQTMKLCVDARMEKNTVLSSMAEHKTNCSTYDVKAANGNTTVDSDCIFNGRRVMSTTTMSGNFNSDFQISIESTTTNPEKTNQSTVVKRTITQIGKYVSDKCGDLKPGEAEGTDGTRLLVQ
jgi:hypothetical protein